MAVTLNRYTGDGSTTRFVVSFEQYSWTSIVVTVNNVTKTAGVDYTYDSVAKEVVFTVAPLQAAAITIKRLSDVTLLYRFGSGAAFTGANVDADFDQFAAAVEEVQNAADLAYVEDALAAEEAARIAADQSLQAQISGDTPAIVEELPVVMYTGNRVTNSMTIPGNKNAFSVGQVTIAPGQEVILGEGTEWYILGNLFERDDLYDVTANKLSTSDGLFEIDVNNIATASALALLTTRVAAEETKVQSVALGGTGGTTALGARTNLGLYELLGNQYSKGVSATITTAAATATFTADEVLVAASNTGVKYLLRGLSASINLATTGAGGMDTGTVPATGFVAIYAIYNPTTGLASLLAVNATSAAASQIYAGSNMPSGYTCSALISVWRVASSVLVVGYQRERDVRFAWATVVDLTAQATPATGTFSLSTYVPLNAKSAHLIQVITAGTSTATVRSSLAPSSALYGMIQGNGYSVVSGQGWLDLTTAQSAYREATTSTGTMAVQVYTNGYRI